MRHNQLMFSVAGINYSSEFNRWKLPRPANANNWIVDIGYLASYTYHSQQSVTTKHDHVPVLIHYRHQFENIILISTRNNTQSRIPKRQ